MTTANLTPARTMIVDLPGPDLSPAQARWLARHDFGGVCLFARNITTPERTARLIREVRDALGRDVPVATDQEGGAVLRRLDVPHPPTPQALGVLDDPEAARHAGALAARGLIELGLNWNFAPSLDVNSDPLNPVIGERAFGSDPARVAALGVAWAQGSQSVGVLCAVKHFPGHGATRVDSHLALPVVHESREELAAGAWVPFREAVRAGVGSVMTAHVLYPALDPAHPATCSAAVLTGLLRREWGYRGLIVTDALDMQAVAGRYEAGQGAVLALQAGADALLVCGHGDPEVIATHLGALNRAQRAGELTPERLAEAGARLSAAEQAFPGTPQPYTTSQRARDEEATHSWATRALTWVGPPTTLDPHLPTLLFAPESAAVGGPYGDALSGAALADALRGTWPQLHFAPLEDHAAVDDALQRFPNAPALLATTGRWGLPEAAHQIAARLRQRPAPALHLVLWNPEDAGGLGLPTLVTHGFRPVNLRAAARHLAGVDAE